MLVVPRRSVALSSPMLIANENTMPVSMAGMSIGLMTFLNVWRAPKPNVYEAFTRFSGIFLYTGRIVLTTNGMVITLWARITIANGGMNFMYFDTIK